MSDFKYISIVSVSLYIPINSYWVCIYTYTHNIYTQCILLEYDKKDIIPT